MPCGIHRKQRSSLAIPLLAVVIMGAAFGQEPLTNDAVIKMVKGGLDEQLIVTVIEGQPAVFSTTPDDLLRLKQEGVTSRILSAMVKKAGARAIPGGSRPNGQELASRPQGGAAASGGANTFFVTWRDPRENAFEVGVPKGWNVTGGLIRQNAVDAGGTVQVQSPDGKIQILIGDPDLHSYETPSQMTRMMGIREGQSTSTAWGGKVVISRYLSGSQFAEQYVRSRLCRQAAITDRGELRELSAEMNSILQAYSTPRFGGQFASQASAGEAAYQCGSGSGYLQATTLWIRSTGPAAAAGAMWWVWRMGGYQVTDPEQSGLAYYVLNTMLETFKFNPQWEARNEQSVDAATKSIMNALDDIAKRAAQFAQRQASAASAGGYNHPNTGQLPTDLRKKWAIESASLQKYSDATMGQTWMHSSTGENVRVSNSSTNWWRNTSGNVVSGPESGSPPPGGGWEQLQPGWR